MSRKRNYKQTRRAVSISGDLYAAIRAHCERAGLSISGYAEMVLRREMGMEEREGHLERSPILVEAHKASKSSKKASSDQTVPLPDWKPDPVIADSYEPPIVFRGEGEKPEPPAPETTFSGMGGRIEPLPEPVEVVYLDPEEPLVALEEPAAEETESDYQQVGSEEIPNNSEGLAIEPTSEPTPPPLEIPQDSEELEPEVFQEPVLAHKEVQVPDEPTRFERESDPGEPESEAQPEVEEDPRPIHAVRTDRPSREFMSKGERERLERAQRIAEKEKEEAARLKEAQEKEDGKEESPSRLAGNVFSF